MITGQDKLIVVVSGLPRSGTSMMMKMLEAGGIPPVTDNQRMADDDNPKGYYEFERVKKLDKGDTEWLADAPGKVVKVIATLLTYLPPTYNYKVIFMRRLMPEILASQRQMLVRRGKDPNKFKDQDMARIFEKHVKKVDAWIATQPNLQRIDMSYNDMLKDSAPHIARLNEFLGGGLDTARMAEVVDVNLHRNRKD